MSPPSALGAETRPSRLRRERSSPCARGEPETAGRAPLRGVPAGGRLTLGQLLEGVWEGLHAGGAAACPMCRTEIRPGAPGAAARCEACGTAVF